MEHLSEKVKELNRDNFAVRQHLKYVDLYSDTANYQALTYEDTLLVREELAPLILPDEDEASAVRFDALLYGLELAYLDGKKYGKGAKRSPEKGSCNLKCGEYTRNYGAGRVD